MPSKWNTTNFGVAVLSKNGHVREATPDSDYFRFAASAANLALEILHTPEAKTVLKDIALDYDKTLSKPWYGGFAGSRQKAFDRVCEFVSSLADEFPFIVIDEKLCGGDIFGFHDREAGRPSPWDPRQCDVYLNGEMFHDMMAVQDSETDFGIYQFSLAVTLVHEVGGHVLLTYLGADAGDRTPLTKLLENQNPLYPESRKRGEAGAAVERLLFGGVFDFARVKKKAFPRPGIPFLDKDGEWFEIKESSIWRIIDYDFVFPLRCSKTPLDVRNLRENSIYKERARGCDAVSECDPGLRRGFEIRSYGKNCALKEIPSDPTRHLKVV